MINSKQGHGQDKIYFIIVNGRQKEVTEKILSYTAVVLLAFPDDPVDDKIEYTVAYANPHGKDGTLVASQTVHIKEGMIFNVTKTNRS